MAKVQAMFTSRNVLSRGLTALHHAGVQDDQVEIREQRPRTGQPGFEYVDEEDRGAHVRMMGEAGHTLAATGENLVGSPSVSTTDTNLSDLLAAMAQKEDDEERPEYRSGTRFQLIVNTDDAEGIAHVLDENGGKDVRIRK